MPFRADEAKINGYDRARSYLVSRHIHGSERVRSEEALADIVDEYGPVVDRYPHWHPLVVAHSDPRSPATLPGRDCGYAGLDHTVYFANGLLTCPYGDVEQLIDAVDNLPAHPLAAISAQYVDAQLYHPHAKPILVTCEWHRPLPLDGMIPKSWAVPLLLELELPCWRWAKLAETWETMPPYFLGCPHGGRSSLFVNQETGQAIKTIWKVLIHTGMFGPIKV